LCESGTAAFGPPFLFNAGKANNVIPDSAQLGLSVRALDRDVRDLLETRIRALVNAQAESFGVRAEVRYKRDYPVLVNSIDETGLLQSDYLFARSE
jgi:hippurate hydrolase